MEYNNLYLLQEIEEDMTLIIGAKCKDGVVLIADRRIVEGTDIATGDKITFLPLGILVAGAGVAELIDKFNERIPFVLDERKRLNFEEMRKENPNIDINDVPFYFRPYEFLEDCEGLVFQLTERYKQPLQILVASGNLLQAELSYIDNEGFLASKRRTYISIGSGSPYANFILKKIWNKNLKMKEMAKMGKLIISIITESGIDTFVGNGTQIVFIPNFPDNFEGLSVEEQRKYYPHQENLEDFDDEPLRKEFYKSLNDLFGKVKED